MTTSRIRLLVVEDNPADRRLISEILKDSVDPLFEVVGVGLLADGLKRLREEAFDIVLLDLDLPDSRGLEGLERIVGAAPAVPVVVLTGVDDENLGVQAMQREAADYLTKGKIDLDVLVRSVKYSIERKRIDQALRRSREDLSRAQAVARTGSWRLGVPGNELEWSDETYRMFGIPPGTPLTYERFLAVVHPDDREYVDREWKAALRGEPYDIEHRIVVGGEVKWVRERAEIELGADGLALGGFGTVQDVTQRKRVEETLLRSEALYRAIARSIPDGAIFVVDREMRYLVAEGGLTAKLGVVREKLEGTTPRMTMEEEWGPHVEERFAKALAGETASYENEFRGCVLWTQYSPLRDENDAVFAAMAISMDVTERKRAEEERLEFHRQLLHAQKLESLGVMAGGIAHDFNNILMAVLGNLELALMDLPPEHTARENINQSVQATLRAAGLTRQMLAYSGKGAFQIKRLDLSDLVRENADLFRTAVSRNAALNLSLTDEPSVIEGDPGQLQQVVMNLVTNASEAIGDKAGAITLATGVGDFDAAYLAPSRTEGRAADGRYAYLEVSDTGCGMDDETQSRLFDPFFTTKFTGRGLGMSALLGIVRGHRGFILVDSVVGEGTTIRILFPVCGAGLDAPREVRLAPAVPSATALQAAAPTVLVVDDEESIRNLCLEFVRHMGFRGLTASNGEEGVTLFEQHADEIAFVLLDLTMPRMDGVSAFREMKRLRPGVQVILSSGYNEKDAVQRFGGEGLAGFIQKPYRLSELKDKVARLFRKGES
ncbi:response regulator [Candidatus Sumerlaeota bacterium]|nr:response regulator [Candidatus Sumerlaeota bacterium]